MRRVALLKPTLTAFGIDERRLRLEWISASEGEKFARVTAEFTGLIRSLGPLNWRQRRRALEGKGVLEVPESEFAL